MREIQAIKSKYSCPPPAGRRPYTRSFPPGPGGAV